MSQLNSFAHHPGFSENEKKEFSKKVNPFSLTQDQRSVQEERNIAEITSSAWFQAENRHSHQTSVNKVNTFAFTQYNNIAHSLTLTASLSVVTVRVRLRVSDL